MKSQLGRVLEKWSRRVSSSSIDVLRGFLFSLPERFIADVEDNMITLIFPFRDGYVDMLISLPPHKRNLSYFFRWRRK